jgi:hypothetical protein
MINEIKRMQLLAGLINESQLNEEIKPEDIKIGQTYIASMPALVKTHDKWEIYDNDDIAPNERVDVKVKVAGASFGDEAFFTVIPLEDKDYINPTSKEKNSYKKGRQYGIKAKFLKPLA